MTQPYPIDNLTEQDDMEDMEDIAFNQLYRQNAGELLSKRSIESLDINTNPAHVLDSNTDDIVYEATTHQSTPLQVNRLIERFESRHSGLWQAEHDEAVEQAVATAMEPVATVVEPVETAVEPVATVVEPVEMPVEPVPTVVEPVTTVVEPVEMPVEPVPTVAETGFTSTQTSSESWKCWPWWNLPALRNICRG